MVGAGLIIKTLRKQQKITQEALCENICTASYLSRIESGDAKASDDTIEALLQRLGTDLNKYINYQTEEDIRIAKLKYDIRTMSIANQMDDHLNLLNDLKKIADPSNRRLQQFVLLQTFISEDRNNDANPEKMLKLLNNALALTKKRVEPLNLRSQYLTFDEIVLYSNIAIMEKRRGNIEKSIIILKELTFYLEHERIAVELKAKLYPFISYNLANNLLYSKKYLECLVVTEKLIQSCRDFNSLTTLPKSLLLKAEALYYVSDFSESFELYRLSYFVSLASARYDLVDLVKSLFESKPELMNEQSFFII